MKDHEIRDLITAVTNHLHRTLAGHGLPNCLRMLVHDAVIKYLDENNLRSRK
jgi:hypothetical protein